MCCVKLVCEFSEFFAFFEDVFLCFVDIPTESTRVVLVAAWVVGLYIYHSALVFEYG